MELPSLCQTYNWYDGGMVETHSKILDRRRKEFKRQKEKNLDKEHSEKPNQDRASSMHGPSFCCLCLIPILAGGEANMEVVGGRSTGPGSGQPAPLAGEIYRLAELGREGACNNPGYEKQPVFP